jgi:hypothetical protein
VNEPLEVFSHTKGKTRRGGRASSVDSDQHSLARMMLGYAMRLLDWPGSLRNVVRARTESRCGSVANTLYLFHNQREVDDFLAGKAEW